MKKSMEMEKKEEANNIFINALLKKFSKAYK